MSDATKRKVRKKKQMRCGHAQQFAVLLSFVVAAFYVTNAKRAA